MTIDPSILTLNTKNADNAVALSNPSSQNVVVVPPSSTAAASLYQNRTVARPVANLGNTCYMNAVLQALAHAPELCLAMDCNPHSITCPIAASNASKQLDRSYQSIETQQQAPRSSPTSSPDVANAGNGSRSGVNGAPAGGAPTRKSRRTGRKSPRNSDVIDGTTLGALNTSNESHSNDGIKFCTLCEVERHMREVHDQTSSDKAVVPESIVHGFFDEVAPWFKLGIQEDSHEFLRLLIDAMQKSCRRARRSYLQNVKQNHDAAYSAVDADETKSDDTDSRKDIDDLTKTDLVETKAEHVSVQSNLHSPIVKSPRSQSNDKEYPFSLFRGSVESKVVCCHCQATSSTLDPIEDVGLEVASSTEITGMQNQVSGVSGSQAVSTSVSSSPLLDVQTAFQRYASTEALDSGYKCEKCGKVGRATKQSRLASIPPILTLHLKRFRYGGNETRTSNSTGVPVNSSGSGNVVATPTSSMPTRATRSTRSSEVSQLLGATDYFVAGKSGSAKIEGHIKFDPVFDLRPYLTKELQDQHTNMFCRLFAVIVHAGKNSHSGHYISYVRNVTMNEWYKMDDSRVSPATLQEVLNAEAYMLFYRVVQHPISIMLEELYNKKKIEQENIKHDKALMTSDHPSTNTAVDVCVDELTTKVSDPISTSTEIRKRANTSDRVAVDSSMEGEEWLRTKTNVPPYLHGIVRKAQQVIADNIEVTPAVRQKIVAVARSTFKGSTKNGKDQLSPRSIITEDDIVGGTDPIRRSVIKLFYQLEQQQKSSSGGGRISSENNMDEQGGQQDDNVDWFTLPESSIVHHKNNGSSELHDLRLTHNESELNVKVTPTSSDLVIDHEGTGIIPSSNMIIEEAEDSIGLL